MNPHISDEQLLAYLDAQLPQEADYITIEAALQADAVLQERLQLLVVSADHVRSAFRPKLMEPVPTRLIQAVLDAPLPQAQPLARPAVPTPKKTQRPGWRDTLLALFPGQHAWGGAAMASVAWMAAGLLLWNTFPQGEPSPTLAHWAQTNQTVQDTRVLTALQAVPSGQVVRVNDKALEILATFELPSGEHCRELQEHDPTAQGVRHTLALACQHNGGAWSVRFAASHVPAPGGFQTASDALTQAMDDYLNSQSALVELSAADEAALIQRSWER